MPARCEKETERDPMPRTAAPGHRSRRVPRRRPRKGGADHSHETIQRTAAAALRRDGQSGFAGSRIRYLRHPESPGHRRCCNSDPGTASEEKKPDEQATALMARRPAGRHRDGNGGGRSSRRARIRRSHHHWHQRMDGPTHHRLYRRAHSGEDGLQGGVQDRGGVSYGHRVGGRATSPWDSSTGTTTWASGCRSCSRKER